MITPPSKLLRKIAGRLSGSNYHDLTVAERQIVDLLIPEGFLYCDSNNDLRDGETDTKKLMEQVT